MHIIDSHTRPGSKRVEWRSRLAEIWKTVTPESPLAVVGVGNALRGDDGAGSLVAQRLRRFSSRAAQRRVRVWDVGIYPESELNDAIATRPAVVLFIDSVEMSLPPGSIRLVEVEKTTFPIFTTHNIPLKVLSRFFPQGVAVFLLGIQPSSTEFGSGLSDEVKRACDEVVLALRLSFSI